MRWKGRRQSDNVEDRRGGGGKKIAVGGGLGVIIIALIAAFMGQDPKALMDAIGNPAAAAGGSGGGAGGENVAVEESPEEKALVAFVKTVLADTEDVWNAQFAAKGTQYKEPMLVLFRDGVQSACGFQEAAVGPFYCPGDEHVYLDLDFFDQLSQQLGAPGDFAQAYVIAHEVGHHIQNLVGTSGQVHAQQRGLSKEAANQLSVRLELQADFLAGVWAHHAQRTKRVLEPGDLKEALRAAAKIGDDTLQRRARGRVMPESFTHGTSEQRMRWFQLGFETGDWSRGDTFSIPYDEL